MREEDWFNSLEDIDNKYAAQQAQVHKLNAQGPKVTLQERLKNSSDLVKLASRKLEMLVGASSALGLQGNLPGRHADQAQKFMSVVNENVNIAKREAEMMQVTEREKEKMIANARRDCENLDAQASQLDSALGSLSSESQKLQAAHGAASVKVQQAMEALRLAQSEEAAAAAAKEAHMGKVGSVKNKLNDVNAKKAAASTRLRSLTSVDGDGGMPVLQAAQEQADIANGLGGAV